MSETDTVRVELGARSYDIHVGAGLLRRAGHLIEPLLRHQPCIIVTDRTVAGLHLDALAAALDDTGISHDEIVLDAGEQNKNLAGLGELTDAILDHGVERGSTLIALGGGVIGDITGFAAAIALRGIDFIQIPTTLLSQVDSSVGGKTGINTRHGKNLIGAFYQPRLVLADTGTLDTLSRRELLAGYAETVKYGLIGDAEFFAWLESHGALVIDSGDNGASRRQAVTTSCRAKAAIVAEDEHEQGCRALLNLGHTFGHALEAETGFGPGLLHGEAVAVGMVMAFDLSVALGHCPAEDAARLRRHMASVGLPVGVGQIDAGPLRVDALIDHMCHDKKVRGGRISFVLTRGIGEAFITDDVALADVERLLKGALAA